MPWYSYKIPFQASYQSIICYSASKNKRVQICRDIEGKRKDDKNIYKSAYFNSRAQIVLNPNDFLPSLQVLQQQLVTGIAVWLSEGSGWVISSIDEHYINTIAYDPLRGKSFIPLPQELQNSAKGLVNLKKTTMSVSVGVISAI